MVLEVPPLTGFRLVSLTQAEEDCYDYVQHRSDAKLMGVFASVVHIVKGALGAGVLSGHVAYMKAGVNVAVPVTFIFGFYMGYCLNLLVKSAQILYKRTHIPSMSYPDVGEAAMACFPDQKIARYSKYFRYFIDIIIMLNLFGVCACYQVLIAKSIQQLAAQSTTIQEAAGYPGLRFYLVIMMVPTIAICLIRHLKSLAPFSFGANAIILLCIIMTVYYATNRNPTFSNMKTNNKESSFFELIGNIVFGMSCSGLVLPIENHMRDPKKFTMALSIGMSLIVVGFFMVAYFGYAGYLEKCESPITANFPMTLYSKILKGLIAFMIFITHALNFWVPFNLIFYYIKQNYSEDIDSWELKYRTMFVILIALVAIAFPDVDALIGFIGTFCLSNMAFIFPNLITLLVIWDRPGLGKYQWRLWRGILLSFFGGIVLIYGSYVNGMELLGTFFR